MNTALISCDIVPTTDVRLSMIEAPRPAIPTEVVEQIIDMVAEFMNRFDGYALKERIACLHACALVARSWLPRSRLHLFRHILLCSDLSTMQFLSSLILSPVLAQYVEILQMSPNDNQSCGWIYKALSALPPLLPHLRDLAFCELPDLHPACIAVLSRLRTVESLWLYGLHKQSLREVVQLISRFPQLRQLHVIECTWDFPGRCYSGKQHNLATLDVDTDSFDCDESLWEWAVASGSTCALTTFRTVSNVAGSATMDRVLHTCCSTLQELHLNLYHNNEVPLLTNYLALQRLALHGNSEDMIPELARIPGFAPSSLIGICVDPWEIGTPDVLEEVPESQWKALDLALCDSKFPHLTSVGFTYSKMPLQDAHAWFQRVLPKSYERGIL